METLDTAVALCTIEEARSFCFKDDTFADKDALLIPRINSFSRIIADVTGRQLFAEDSATKMFAYSGRGVLSFDRFELRSVDSIVVSAPGYSASDYTLQQIDGAYDYILQPLNRTPQGTYWWMRMYRTMYDDAGMNSSGLDGYPYLVTITGDWGCSAIPYEAHMALLTAVDESLKNPSGQQTVDVGGLVQTNYSRAGNLPISPLPEAAMAWLFGITRPDSLGA